MTAALHTLTLSELGSLLRSREVSPVDVVQASLDRMESTEPELQAFISRTGDSALAEARQAEAEIAAGDYRGRLHGIPFAVKDNLAVRGTVTTAGARFLADNTTADDAEAVRRLRQAGAVVVGKTNLHELAFGSTTINPHYGTTRNPWRLDHVAGGSSGGSAAAVASGQVPLALGTDHAGSIRIPAALCGIVGVKPTHGLVSVRGLVGSRNITADHVGPMARTVADAAVMLDVLAGHDPLDPCSADRRSGNYSAGLSPEGLAGKRVGVPTSYYFDLIDREVETLVRAAVSRLEQLGATVVDVRMPDLEAMVGARVALGAEGLAFADPFLRTVPEQFSDELRRTMMALYFVPARDLARASRVRRLLQERFAATFEEVDLLATPSTCVAAFPVEAPTVGSWDRRNGQDVEVPSSRSLIRATWPTNLTGNPAVSVPAGFTAAGLPVGLQLTARPFEEALLLSAAYAFEQTTTWSARHPSL
jgi:aspartyl-tRNA(Asn)/glutamyl-tRNA(Gln) amidotransferase subunit A